MPSIESVLKAVAPGANATFVKASANAGAVMVQYGIKSTKAQCQLIAQMGHESGGFRLFEEGMSYSAERLTKVWPKRFPTIEDAQPYARNPKALAIKVYGNRMGNRPGSDDGWNFRGSGALQHTGASEFARVEKRTGLPVTTNPSLLRSVDNADAMWRAACSYFVDRGALAAADRGETSVVTKKVNGGFIGLTDRAILVKRAEAAFVGETITVAPTTVERAEDAKRKATRTTVGAPAGGAAGGGASKQTPGTEWGTAIAIGVCVAVALGALAIVYWRRHAAEKAAVETMRLKSIAAKLELPPVAA